MDLWSHTIYHAPHCENISLVHLTLMYVQNHVGLLFSSHSSHIPTSENNFMRVGKLFANVNVYEHIHITTVMRDRKSPSFRLHASNNSYDLFLSGEN